MTINVTLLGSGNPLPDPHRAGPSTLVEADGRHLLFDAGRAASMRLAAAGLFPLMLDAVFLTHLHSDHITDLNDIVTSRWVMSPVPTPTAIYGPPGTAGVVDGILAMLGPDISYRLAHHDDLNDPPDVKVIECASGETITFGGAVVTTAETDHRPVEPTLGYRIEADGSSVVIAGDTLPCDDLDSLCRGADIYVQTVLRDDLVNLVPMQRFRDTIDYHSTVAQAAQTAQRCGVRTLVLTHQVPTPAPGSADEWIAIAAEHFNGSIVFGEDGLMISTDQA